MTVGTAAIDGLTYIFNENGAMTQGWYNDMRSYLLGGKPSQGIVGIDGESYYFGSDNLMKTGFISVGDKQYYFGNDGKMLKNTSVGLYTIDNSGVCTRAKTITSELAKYRADEIIAEVGTDPAALCDYVSEHIKYVYVYVDAVYNDPYNADWAGVAAYGMNRGTGACYHDAAFLNILLARAGYRSRIVIGNVGFGNYFGSFHVYNQLYKDGEWVVYDAVNHLHGVTVQSLKEKSWIFREFVEVKY